VAATRRFGRRLIALRDSPAASATIGVNLVGTKLAVFALSAAMAGFAGGILGMFRGTAGAMDFQITDVLAIGALLLLVVWGVSTVSGALFGGIASVLLVILQNDVTWVVFGVAVFVTITRVGPGLASFSVVRSPRASRSTRAGSSPASCRGATTPARNIRPSAASSARLAPLAPTSVAADRHPRRPAPRWRPASPSPGRTHE